MLGLMSAVMVLKFLIIFEQGTLHFHFVLDLTNDVAGPAYLLYLPIQPKKNCFVNKQTKKML